jgi:hypothetical protein
MKTPNGRYGTIFYPEPVGAIIRSARRRQTDLFGAGKAIALGSGHRGPEELADPVGGRAEGKLP